MFYSHEILTNRKYGVATIWLAATLGSKSGKKLNRKAICNVDLQKACGTIIEPQAPMALRLSGNLLFGAVRVYSQQCGYVLHDAQAAQNNLRALFKVSRTQELDLDVSKARPDQLMRLDDPAFELDHALPALDFDFMALPINNDSQRSTQSMMSIHPRSGSVVSSASSMPNMNLGSSSGNGDYQLPSGDKLGGSSAHKPLFGNMGDDEPHIYQDENQMEDVGLYFGEDGNLVEDPFLDASRQISPRPQTQRGSEAAMERVRQDHAGGALDDDIFNIPDYGNDDYHMGGLDGGVLPENVEPFPERDDFLIAGGLGQDDQRLGRYGNLQDRVHGSARLSSSITEEEMPSVSAKAPQKKRRKTKQQAADDVLVVRTKQLHIWREEYLEIMKAGNILKSNHKAAFQAKKNALHFVYGTGIMGVGEGHGASKFASPLNMFSGPALMAKITGFPIPSPAKSSKRTRDGEDEQPSSSPKRYRNDDEVGRDYDSQIQMILDNDMPEEYLNDSDDVEQGRRASSALNDHPSSAMMPWNRSNSHHSHQKLLSSRGPGSVIVGSVGRRLTSPLVGRGSAIPGDLEQFNIQHEENRVMYGRDDDSDMPGSQPLYGGFPSSSRAGPLVDDAEFEQFGPAAEVDTQTAGQSQWVAQALDKESNNFFEYIQNTIMEREDDELSFDENQVAREVHKSVTFGELFPEGGSAVVAAQAFYHILTLATRNRLLVQQMDLMVEEMDEEQEKDICGEIEIRVRELI